MSDRWTPVQERVMDKVYGRTLWAEDGRLIGEDPEHPIWRAPCGHRGTQMTIDPHGIVTCHHELANRHDHTHWTAEMWSTWTGDHDQYCKPPKCERVTCGRKYSEAEVFAE